MILALGATAAHAENFYLLISAGQGKIDVGSLTGTVNGEQSSAVGKLQLGYRFGKYFALEGGYYRSGAIQFHAPGIDGALQSSGWELYAVGLLPLSDELSLFGKIGSTRLRVAGTARIAGVGNISSTGSATETSSGLGLHWEASKNWALRTEYGSGKTWLVSVAYKF